MDLSKDPTTNIEWAAQRIATDLTRDEVWVLQDALKQLDTVLYKGWAKDLTLSQLIEAANMANESKRDQ